MLGGTTPFEIAVWEQKPAAVRVNLHAQASGDVSRSEWSGTTGRHGEHVAKEEARDG